MQDTRNFAARWSSRTPQSHKLLSLIDKYRLLDLLLSPIRNILVYPEIASVTRAVAIFAIIAQLVKIKRLVNIILCP
jgi:hypothetical protein